MNIDEILWDYGIEMIRHSSISELKEKANKILKRIKYKELMEELGIAFL